jgi:hypothetical protein
MNKESAERKYALSISRHFREAKQMLVTQAIDWVAEAAHYFSIIADYGEMYMDKDLRKESQQWANEMAEWANLANSLIEDGGELGIEYNFNPRLQAGLFFCQEIRLVSEHHLAGNRQGKFLASTQLSRLRSQFVLFVMEEFCLVLIPSIVADNPGWHISTNTQTRLPADEKDYFAQLRFNEVNFKTIDKAVGTFWELLQKYRFEKTSAENMAKVVQPLVEAMTEKIQEMSEKMEKESDSQISKFLTT